VRVEELDSGYLVVPDGNGPFPGVVVIHEAGGLNDNIRDICNRFAGENYTALGVDLFKGRSRPICMARMFVGAMRGDLNHFGVPDLKDSLGRLSEHPDVDSERIGAVGFCLGGSIVLTWGCTENRLKAIAPWYGAAPRPRSAIRRLCPVVGSWPDRDFTSGAVEILESELTAAGTSHDLKIYPGTKHAFFNDHLKAYNAEAAADSWQRVLAFFSEHVKGED
jgi:carboxymethylenebutenolidase